MTEYMECLHAVPSTFATGDKSTAIMLSMDATATRLGLYAFSAEKNTSYQVEMNEMVLSEFKKHLGDGITWETFFKDLLFSFNTASVKLIFGKVPQGGIELQCLKGETSEELISFVLMPTVADVQTLLMERMTQSHQIYSHPKEHELRLSRIEAEEKEEQAKREGLDHELLALNENLTRNKSQEAASNKRKVELQRRLSKFGDDKIVNPWKAVEEKQREAAGAGNESRIPNPLHNKTCKNFDLVLLRLIKSKFITAADCDSSSPGNRVIMPFTAEELNKQVGQLTGTRSKVWRELERINAWNYNVFAVQAAMSGDDYSSLPYQPNGGSLFVTMYALLCKYNFLQKFKIDEQVALNWISAVEAGYHGNPYHNSMHAADVLQITHYIISQGGLAKKCGLSDLQIFSALLSASIHDFDHPGINNNFHIKSGSHLSTLYNDRSVLESLHVSRVFELMKNPVFNILSNFPENQWREIRETMIEMVLATDMGSHGKFVSSLKSKLQERANFTNTEEQILGLSIALKMADISNCGRPQDIYLQWSGKVSDEFYQQGDRERNLGMQCSPFMDRTQKGIAKGQIAFMNYIIIPFFEVVSELLPDMRFSVGLAEENKIYWANNDDS